MSKPGYSGWTRSRTTPRSVKRAEVTAKAFIVSGGIGTILAVILIFGFLLWVVSPLFVGGDFEPRNEFATTVQNGESRVLTLGMDEYRLMAYTFQEDSSLRVLRLDDGTVLSEQKLVEGPAPTAVAFTPEGSELVLGFEDGTVRTGRIGFDVTFLEDESAPESLRGIEPGQVVEHEGALVQLTPEGQLRSVRMRTAVDEPVEVAKSPIRRIDFTETPSGRAYGVLAADGTLAVYTESSRTNMLTGETIRRVDEVPLPYDPPGGRGLPAHLELAGIANLLYLVWEDGYTLRYDARDAERAAVAETLDLVDGGGRVTSVRFLIGKTTLLVGDSTGTLRAWFPTKPDNAETIDGVILVAGHTIEGPRAPVEAIAPSPRSRLFALGYGDGTVRIYQMTSGKLVAETDRPTGHPVIAATVAPKEDGVLALGHDGLRTWDLAAGHPDASFGSLFGKVWYESQPEKAYVWQSTGGTDDFEPKLGLMPLIFGTLKATLYSMLIAIPIALLAALFTSEFLNPKMRTPIKSVVEMMASLPSVVLGFLAALIIAPFVQQVVPATLAAFMTVPFALLLGSRLWQLLPQDTAIRWSGAPRVGAIFLMLPVGILGAILLGPVVEGVFFGGDLKGWLSGRVGSGLGGWVFLLIPVGVLVVAYGVSRFAGPWIRATTRSWDRGSCALFDIGRLVATLVGGILFAWLVGGILSGVGFDPRGSIVGTYAQRNAMIVGFVMGFAIVPIIYTLAEDALASVPMQLREGSLGAGATPWQTATRIIIPTAMSGLFGAMMVGLGRAVGETMIVLMAAGNTPIMDWNIFNGFRTLSANIAVELPEAVKDSTHYRTLFLAALVLFAMTFVINTIAEMVRRRFRKRYAEQL